MSDLVVTGMYGIGDNLHQRAVVRELMRSNEVWLKTYYPSMYHDLVADGLKLVVLSSPPPRIKDTASRGAVAEPPARARQIRISYDKEATVRSGSLIAAQFASAGLVMPARPNFALPVKDGWRAAARALIATWDTGGKPVMVYRPVVVNKSWECPARSPDTESYATLYRAVRDKFFVVSVADLTSAGERIVGAEQAADVKLHKGELPFETLAGLFAEVDLVFGCPGFAPILAQAVGTPTICVYGGNESYRTTNEPGSHLAPTLAIEPINPCECFSRFHDCDKRIDLEPAIERVKAFASDCIAGRLKMGDDKPRALIFGTTYVDTEDKKRLVQHWVRLHQHLNPECDFLLVDSVSPVKWGPDAGVELIRFQDNIGHLARGGRDGWGRAFCAGLQYAIDGDYDYVVHVEGDSLFRLGVLPIVEQMRASGILAASAPVEGTKSKEAGWVETGLMAFDVGYLRASRFIERYDWPNRKASPTPEAVIARLLGDDLKIMPWRAERGDRGQINTGNVQELDWITHCADPMVYDRFVATHIGERQEASEAETVKLNFGCGTNHLPGWQNFDSETDIGKPLPFPDGHADFIYAEHCVEHIDYYSALRFFAECRRVLKPGGVIRICVPSLENVMKRADRDYCEFVKRWAPSVDVRGAMHAILYAHGHKTAWTASLLESSLFFAGFEGIEHCEQHCSRHPDLTGVEGHHKVIGERMNWIESAICEGTAAK